MGLGLKRHELINALSSTLRAFCDLPWFQHVWTLQEAVSPRDLILRVEWTLATWNDFAQACWTVHGRDLVGKIQEIFYTVTSLRLSLMESGPTALELPWTGIAPRVNRKASDDRDHVCGVIGLYNVKVMEFLKPSHCASIETVFMDGTIALLKADESLDVLGVCCTGCRSSRYSLPSW